jgi:dihydropyrimidinase
MGVVYSEGVSKRGMSLRQFVDITSTNAARIYGLYPRKGVIQVGSDADLALLSLGERQLSMNDFHVADYSPWEGWQVTAWPSTTVLRGKVITNEGRLLGRPGDGQWLPRQISNAILARPAC